MKKYTKTEFNSSKLAEMKPGETIVIECANARDVQNVRTSAAQFKRLNEPEGIVRFASVAKTNGDGTYNLELTAMTE